MRRRRQKQEAAKAIRDRIVELIRVPARELVPHPGNWRKHPAAQQRALQGMLQEVGYVDALLARRDAATGTLHLIDGHLRAETTPETEVPVLVLDVDAAEADKILATFDPLGAMADKDAAAFEALVADMEVSSPAVAELLEELSGVGLPAQEEEIEIEPHYSVIIKCTSEEEQKAVLLGLADHDLDVRAVVVGYPKAEPVTAETEPTPARTGDVRIVRESAIQRSPRVLQLEGQFDIPPAARSSQEWSFAFTLDRPWNIGLIVGPSGSGKSTAARELFGAQLVSGWDWPAEAAIVDGFPAEMPLVEITSLLSSVGFSSTPDWLKPFAVLSNGQQFRVNLARTLAEQPGLAVVDEFTSVVDRTVAQIGSAALAKTIRASGRRFVAVTCHYDVLEWLQPDWVLEMPAGTLDWRCLRRRPEISVSIRRVGPDAWSQFRQHHYLSHALNRSAHCFQADIAGRPVAFTGVIFNPHANGGFYREHRTVCLPDFQGVGLGNRMSEFVASLFASTGRSYHSVTSHPAMIRHRLKSPDWICTRPPSLAAGGISRSSRRSVSARLRRTTAVHRCTASFEWIGAKRPREAEVLGVLR